MKPFLKWAGNKYRIIDKLKEVLPPGSRLVEPFCGSGSVFLNTEYDSYLVCDINLDLINLFSILKEEGQDFIQYAKSYFKSEFNNVDAFLELRHTFNSTLDPRKKSALFIYLNKHCFNGLCRYNTSGKFNVPFGRYKSPYFPEMELYYFHIKSKRAKFVCSDFSSTFRDLDQGDVVYCDPPYSTLEDNYGVGFTAYSPVPFSLDFDHKNLVCLAKMAARQKIPVIISNHDTTKTRELYEGATIHTFEVQRSISCKGSSRKKVPELLAFYL